MGTLQYQTPNNNKRMSHLGLTTARCKPSLALRILPQRLKLHTLENKELHMNKGDIFTLGDEPNKIVSKLKCTNSMP